MRFPTRFLSSLLLASTAASGALSAQIDPGTFTRGDANGDGFVNISDSIFLLTHLFQGGPAPSTLDAGDANDDGSLSIADVVFLNAFLFQGGAMPPPPFLAPGLDPTPDALWHDIPVGLQSAAVDRALEDMTDSQDATGATRLTGGVPDVAQSVLVDLDADGYRDLLVRANRSSVILAARFVADANPAASTFEAMAEFQLPTDAVALATMDVLGDSAREVVFVRSQGVDIHATTGGLLSTSPVGGFATASAITGFASVTGGLAATHADGTVSMASAHGDGTYSVLNVSLPPLRKGSHVPVAAVQDPADPSAALVFSRQNGAFRVRANGAVSDVSSSFPILGGTVMSARRWDRETAAWLSTGGGRELLLRTIRRDYAGTNYSTTTTAHLLAQVGGGWSVVSSTDVPVQALSLSPVDRDGDGWTDLGYPTFNRNTDELEWRVHAGSPNGYETSLAQPFGGDEAMGWGLDDRLPQSMTPPSRTEEKLVRELGVIQNMPFFQTQVPTQPTNVATLMQKICDIIDLLDQVADELTGSGSGAGADLQRVVDKLNDLKTEGRLTVGDIGGGEGVYDEDNDAIIIGEDFLDPQTLMNLCDSESDDFWVLVSTLIHEAGHALGIDHPATMVEAIELLDAIRELIVSGGSAVLPPTVPAGIYIAKWQEKAYIFETSGMGWLARAACATGDPGAASGIIYSVLVRMLAMCQLPIDPTQITITQGVDANGNATVEVESQGVTLRMRFPPGGGDCDLELDFCNAREGLDY